MSSPRIREDVWKLAEWDSTLLWYAKAIADMQSRRLDDPTGWRYQAAIHEYIPGQDPLARQTDRPPSTGDQRRFWSQCQHGSWFFLPWHRMYLGVFEQIVAVTVVRLGGPTDWALPYWNYSDAANPDARRLPPAFRAATMPDGSPNPLRVDARNPGCNSGDIIADDDDVDVTRCLGEEAFAPPAAGGSPGFGGGRTGFSHAGQITGMLDLAPHGSMHVAVGGWMGRFNTAALDPVFWLHHANIDRLWTVWLKRDPQHHNPTEPRWLTGLSFTFNGAAGNVVSLTASQVVNTTALPWPYRYEDESDPLGAPAGPVVASAETPPVPARREMSERTPEMLGATEGTITIAGRPTRTHITATAPTGPGLAAARAGGASPRIYLNIENITGAGEPTSYVVYLNLPADVDPEDHPELRAGTLPMFGVAEASRTDERNQAHAGSGLQYALEIGDVVRRLQARDSWDPSDIQITFVPKRRGPEPESVLATAAANPIRVGRVSLYVG